jgi:hypothetical protein
MQDLQIELVRPPILIGATAKRGRGARAMHHRALAGILGVCSVHLEYPCDRMRGWKTAAAPEETAPIFPYGCLAAEDHQIKLYFLMKLIRFSNENLNS